MAVKFGNREKIVTGSIATIIVIAVLHLLIFSPKAAEYEKAKKEWQASVDKIEQLKGNVAPSDIERYRKQTERYEQELVRVIKELNIGIPKHYMEFTPEAVEKKRQDFIERVSQLLALGEQSKVKLTFLDEKGWDVPRQLPEPIVKKKINLWDIIADLDGRNLIINAIQNPDLKQRKVNEYNQILLQLGIKAADFPRIEKFGSIVPVIKLFVHAQLVWQERMPAYPITEEKLYDLFRVTFPDNELFFYNKQLDALIDIIKIAEENKIGEISNVNLIEKQVITKKPEEEEEGQETPVAPGGPGRPVPGDLRYMEFMERGIPPEALMEMGLGMPYEFFGTPTPRPEEIIGALMPVKIRYKGSNLNSSQFLHELTHRPRSYLIDDLAIRSSEEGEVEVIATINVTAQLAAVTMDLSEIPEVEEAEK